LPEVVEAEINPLTITKDGVAAVDVRARVAPAGAADTWSRSLPL
jgi:hypothetical protein